MANKFPTGQKGNQGIIDAKRVTTKDRPNKLKNAFQGLTDSNQAKLEAEGLEPIMGDTKSRGTGRNPTGGKGVTIDGSVGNWQYGHYDYDTGGESHLKASKGNPKPTG